MAESRLVPCNLMAWPRIRDLLPDQKLIVYHLWATCHEASGCQLLDLGGFQGALNITMPAIQEAVSEFQRRGLVDLDDATGEVAILDWFRFHKFASPGRRRLLEDSIRRIQSPRLSAIVEKSATYTLREGKEREGKKTPTPQSPRPQAGDTDPPVGGSGVGRGKGKERTPALDPEIEQLIQDELQGRTEAAAKGEAPPISNSVAWLAKLRERAAAGEDITTEHGKRVRARLAAEARHQAALMEPPKMDQDAASVKGQALWTKIRAQRQARASGGMEG